MCNELYVQGDTYVFASQSTNTTLTYQSWKWIRVVISTRTNCRYCTKVYPW